ncbi:uncharacterized protein LOC128724337 [Anopheles nili]|uniref:uncharacterized protein LOC128724337 n=1 Tax=Anopheles nili TaxID=185578 RepID=UPI00237A5922|nr:uncharacterized protein LOC128724337 [Anopheles nili]
MISSSLIILAVGVFTVPTIASGSEKFRRDITQLPLSLGSRTNMLKNEGYNAASSVEMDSYQGLVGRPGIDFPVLTEIPRTVFDCKNHGNGYFADLETRCQVFHICDDGKKISFLCPNGTIFRQLDLICDWWFKVDCAATPNHFAESTEMLTQAKRARLQSKHPVPQPIHQNDDQLTYNIRDQRLLIGNTNHVRRQQFSSPGSIRNVLDLNSPVDKASLTLATKRLSRDEQENSQAADEIQDTAQSASFASVAKKMFNTYYAQEQIAKNLNSANKQKRTDHDNEDLYRDQSTALQLSREASSKSNTNSNRITTNYMPYTTARKLNLNGKVTQFYTPTVPTFTTSVKITTVSPSEDIKVTTKATTFKRRTGVDEGSRITSPSFNSELQQSIRREGTVDDESVMDHAMEIMQTIKNLNIEDTGKISKPVKNLEPEKKADTSDKTYSGLASSSPSLLFATLPKATSFEFLLQPPEGDRNIDINRRMSAGSARKYEVDVGHRSLLTRTTLDEYDKLFHSKNSDGNDGNHIDSEQNPAATEDDLYYVDSQLDQDLQGEATKYPGFGLSNSTQIRELAQIFTHALSAYLQDPVTFRRILMEIRPKAPGLASKSITFQNGPNFDVNSIPSLGETTTYLPPEGSPHYAALRGVEPLEVLDFSDVTTTTTDPSYTDGESTAAITSTLPTTIADIIEKSYSTISHSVGEGMKQGKSLSIKFVTNSRNELADEVNGELGTPASTNHYAGFTDHASFEINNKNSGNKSPNSQSYEDQSGKTNLKPSSGMPGLASIGTEVIPPPQSVLTPPMLPFSFNMAERPKTTVTLEDDEQLQHAQSASILPSHNNQPIYERSKYSVISLPNFKQNPTSGEGLGVTDGVPTTTVEPARDSKPTGDVASFRTTMSYTVFFDPLTINDELMQLEDPRPTVANASAAHALHRHEWNGTFANVESISAAPTTNAHPARLVEKQLEQNAVDMQQKANEMFGDLNEAQADRLMNAMKLADNNKSMRRLILLLIRTCDDDPASTNEESRKALLEALIKIGGVVDTSNGNDLHHVPANESRKGDGNHRRGKHIATDTANVLYDRPVVNAVLPNVTATTENYANVGKFMKESTEDNASEEGAINSEEWPGDNDFHTTVATTKMFYPSAESQTNALPKINYSRDSKWSYTNDEEQRTQFTTTPLPTTFLQTTTESGFTYETTAGSTAPTFSTAAVTAKDSEDATFLSTTTPATTGYRSVESFEADSSSEKQFHVEVSHRLPKDLSSSLANPGINKTKHHASHSSDTRALELLKSLYSLAARWG